MNRTMTTPLAEVLAGLSTSERRTLIRLADASPASSLLSRVLHGLRAQVLMDQAREEAILYALELDRLAELDALDLAVNGEPPAVEGWSVTFDPDTGTWVD